MKRVVLLVILAVLLAVAAGAVTYRFISGAEERALTGFQKVPVYQALEDIPADTTLAAAVAEGLAGPVDFPERYLPTNALTEVTAEDANLITPVDLAAGQILMEGDFVPPADAPVLLAVPPGQAAVSVALGDPQRVGSFLEPGSRIAVLLSETSVDSAGTSTTQTSVLFENVAVLAIGNVSDSSLLDVSVSVGSSGETTLVTLALDPDQVQALVHAVQTGSLYLALLGEGTQVPVVPPDRTVGSAGSAPSFLGQ